MLNKEVFKQQMNKLVNLYPQWKLDVSDKDVISDWYDQFKYYSDKNFTNDVQEYIDNNTYPPTVAGLKNCGTQNLKVRQIPKEEKKELEKIYGETRP